ncbi:MAG: LTA synthase family protein [Bacteroidaceae bacterium]|nr:LTA synthase family protein [Bacteroidaceae bacterium]
MYLITYPLLPCLGFVAVHFLLIILFFQLVQRPLFIWYNRTVNDAGTTLRDLCDIYRHGFGSDLKIASYSTAVPVLLLWAYAHLPLFAVGRWIAVYDVIIVLPLVLLSVADTALYRSWQFKIEASVLHYLRSLKGAFASVSVTYILVALLALGAVYALLLSALLSANAAFDFSVPAGFAMPWWGHLVVVLCNLLIAAAFFIMIRGLKRRPETPVDSYYSRNQFFNHSAVNPVYNFIYSLSVKDDYGSQFREFDPEWCAQRFAPLFPTSGTPQLQLLTTDRPNILLVVWESLCSRFIESLGGKPGVMPQFDRLAREGVYFTNCHAASFRTDRGLVAILSGVLGQPTTSVILHTAKLPHLTALPRRLRDDLGYETMAVHGGHLNIFHKSDYYWASGHDTLVQQDHFPADAPSNSWGVHDGYVFDWLAGDIEQKAAEGKRWFTTFQTLSSHEPFTVPYDRIQDNIVDNSFAYVDDAFGRFIDRLKQSPAWKDLLVVVTGDHGVNLEFIGDKAKNPHIPLLLLGGAVKQPRTIDTLVNQTDIAATLLGQMGLPHDEFIFSRDVTADTYTYPFAFHTYNNGFVFRDATGMTHFDNTSQQVLEGDDPQRIETSKVILQTLYSYLDKL